MLNIRFAPSLPRLPQHPLIPAWLPLTSACVRDSVSDRHKLLLLNSPDLWTHVQLALFIDPEHPRGDNGKHPVSAEMRAVWQRNYTEMLWQLALFPSGRDAMQQEAAVLKALEEVRERGMTAEAREHAAGALMALSDREMHASASDEPKHIMLSYQVRPRFPSEPAQCSVCFAPCAVGLAGDDPAHSWLAVAARLPRVDRHGDDEGLDDGCYV